MLFLKLTAFICIFVQTSAHAQAAEILYHYFGNTHSHTIYSDGDNTVEETFTTAKSKGFDFFAITDHALASLPQFTAQSYEETKRLADQFTDSTFVGIVGFEFTEKDGPGGTGHLNALNTTGYLDATGSSVNIPTFYDWLVFNQDTTVVAAFNHPTPTSFNSFDYLTPARRNVVTMCEVINSGNLKYDAYLTALNQGWRVAPIASLDSHKSLKIEEHLYRTGVLAPSLTRQSIMEAMRQRRVYCTWDKNLRLTFSANGCIMGSVLANPTSLNFHVNVSDPNTGQTGDRITRIEIVGENDILVASSNFSSHTVNWSASCAPQYRYYFAKIYTAGKTDGPTAYSAPIWIDNTSLMTIHAAKTAADYSSIDITQATITAAWNAYFYIEADDRSCGIQVCKINHGLREGMKVDICGSITTNSMQERYILASSASIAGAGTIEPVYIDNRGIGGVNDIDPLTGKGQVGVKDGIGLNNIGLFVRVCGRVNYVDPAGNFVYIDDGSALNDGNTLGARGIRVLTTGVQPPQQGTYAVITGISTLVPVGPAYVRAVRVPLN